jgi:hypothetical protein
MMANIASDGRLAFAKSFRMVRAARQRGVLRIPGAIFLDVLAAVQRSCGPSVAKSSRDCRVGE